MQGTEREFAEWYHGHWRRVVATLTVVTGDAEVAEDATAEAFTRAGFMAGGEPVRRPHRLGLPRRVERGSKPLAPPPTRADRTGPARGATGGALVGTRTPDTALWVAVADLPDRMRTALAMRYIADLPEAEIADAMRITPAELSLPPCTTPAAVLAADGSCYDVEGIR